MLFDPYLLKSIQRFEGVLQQRKLCNRHHSSKIYTTTQIMHFHFIKEEYGKQDIIIFNHFTFLCQSFVVLAICDIIRSQLRWTESFRIFNPMCRDFPFSLSLNLLSCTESEYKAGCVLNQPYGVLLMVSALMATFDSIKYPDFLKCCLS